MLFFEDCRDYVVVVAHMNDRVVSFVFAQRVQREKAAAGGGWEGRHTGGGEGGHSAGRREWDGEGVGRGYGGKRRGEGGNGTMGGGIDVPGS